jgi:DNA-binding protein HU-beta
LSGSRRAETKKAPEIRPFSPMPCKADDSDAVSFTEEQHVNRRELVAAIAEATESDKKSADAFLAAFTDTVTKTVAKGEPVAITGFAKFYRRETQARMGRNPATGEAIKIPAKKAAKITPLKGFKDAVLGAKKK